MASEGVGVKLSELVVTLSWPWIKIPLLEFEGGVYGPEVDKVDVVELGECDGGVAGGVIWGLVSEASNGSCNGKDMTVSVSKNVTLLRELEEAVDEVEEDGDEDGMKKSNSKRVEQPVLSAQIEPSEQQLGKSRRNRIPHKKASPSVR